MADRAHGSAEDKTVPLRFLAEGNIESDCAAE